MKAKATIRRFLWHHFPDVHAVLYGNHVNNEEAGELVKLIERSKMKGHAVILFLALSAVCGGACAQWKQGDVPPSSRRGSLAPTEIDKAEVTVYYAFNAEDIKDENTYIDLGWLQVGQQYTKYASYFVAHSDSTYKPTLIKNSNGESGYASRKFGGKYPSR